MKKILCILSCVLAFIFFSYSTVEAHGFGQRYDLPVPLPMFLYGAAFTVAVSFVLITVFLRPRTVSSHFPSYNTRNLPGIGSLIHSFSLIMVFKILSVSFLFLTVLTGIFGTDKPAENFSVIFVWIIWWVGFAFFSILIGNFWNTLNPWGVCYDLVSYILNKIGFKSTSVAVFKYQAKWELWPAVILFILFAWFENIYPFNADPRHLGIAIILYSIFTWVGMYLFSKDIWLNQCDPFSLMFKTFGLFAPFFVNINTKKSLKSIFVRSFAVGLIDSPVRSVSYTVFVITLLGTVTFDGFKETPLWFEIDSGLYMYFSWMYPLVSWLGGGWSVLSESLGIIAIPLILLILLLLCSAVVSKLVDSTWENRWVYANLFTLSLVPIAIAYHISHYLHYLVSTGQYIIPLFSDPFGFGWDIFGTATFKPILTLINVKFVWYLAVISIVTGHIVGVYISHVVGMRKLQDVKLTLKSQYPMIVVMILYTVISLWIMAQPIVE